MSETGRIQRVLQVRQEAMGDVPARRRIGLLLDADSFVEIDGLVKTDEGAAGVVCGYGAVEGSPVAVFAQDSSVNNGAVGAAHAAKIKKVYDFALKTGVPVVGIYDSHGARLGEGAGALAAYGEILAAVSNMSGVVPQISMVLGTCAGVSALLACSADFVVMSEDAEFYFAAPGKDEASGKAAGAAKSGVAHITCADEATACQSARKLLAMLPLNNLASPPVSAFSEPVDSAARLTAACENVAGTSAADIVAGVCDTGSAVELLADFAECVYTALGTMAGFPCGLVSTSGRLDRDACAKIAKLVSVCDAYQIPVLTFVNAEGMTTTSEEELCGSIRDMARMAHIYAEATTAKIAVLTGAAYGAAYVALAGRASGSDYTIAWPSASVSALPPRTAVAFLHGDEITREKPREKVEAEYLENEASALRAAEGGYIDDVIDPAVTRPALLSALDLLSAKRVQSHPKKHGNLPL